VTAAEGLSRGAADLRTRYTVADLDVLSDEEARRFLGCGTGDPQTDVPLAWELLYRLEPQLYDRLASAERLHRGVVDWLPADVDRIVEVGAGTGRLTLDLIGRAQRIVAIEPAQPLREILVHKLSRTATGESVQVTAGFFDDLPAPDDWSDLVVACSALTPASGHGGETGLREMERVCRPGGCVAIVWPNNVAWLEARGYRHVSFPGDMCVEFDSPEDAVELAAIFYPRAAAEVRRRGTRSVSFETLGINPPRDVAFKVMAP
jgi:ubiquinone/menaquinone biosynthesis C-methylase UbiE